MPKSPFASWMDHLALAFPELSPVPDEENAMTSVLQKEGEYHEYGKLLQFEELGLTITKLSANDTVASTVEAMKAGKDIGN